jgi:hypothetical protein
MKKLCFILLPIAVNFATLYAQNNGAQLKFIDTLCYGEPTYDFGTIPEGPLAKHIFVFKNVGKESLIIHHVSPSCGCTIADWSTQPILPGKNGTIHVQMITQGRVGAFSKSFYIGSNAISEGGRYVLHIKGIIVPDTVKKL